MISHSKPPQPKKFGRVHVDFEPIPNSDYSKMIWRDAKMITAVTKNNDKIIFDADELCAMWVSTPEEKTLADHNLWSLCGYIYNTKKNVELYIGLRKDVDTMYENIKSQLPIIYEGICCLFDLDNSDAVTLTYDQENRRVVAIHMANETLTLFCGYDSDKARDVIRILEEHIRNKERENDN